ncbi:MAG: amidase, partial [Chitinivibrionales bacterium]
MAFLSKSVSETADQIASGEIKSAELVGKAFSRIEEGDKAINSFITLTKERALKRASEIDVMSSEEKRGMALPGIPVAVKDNMSVRGVKTTCASEILGSFVPPYTATAVSHLEREGAVVVGKCNMDEFAMGSSSEKSAFGPVSNPVDNERVAGGSSGGSAASVGADFVPVSLGSDTGGSIRQPANFCGVCG